MPWASVYSVGDVVIALGAVVFVLTATGARLPRVPLRRGAGQPSG